MSRYERMVSPRRVNSTACWFRSCSSTQPPWKITCSPSGAMIGSPGQGFSNFQYRSVRAVVEVHAAHGIVQAEELDLIAFFAGQAFVFQFHVEGAIAEGDERDSARPWIPRRRYTIQTVRRVPKTVMPVNSTASANADNSELEVNRVISKARTKSIACQEVCLVITRVAPARSRR